MKVLIDVVEDHLIIATIRRKHKWKHQIPMALRNIWQDIVINLF